jgi:hypothetical protein
MVGFEPLTIRIIVPTLCHMGSDASMGYDAGRMVMFGTRLGMGYDAGRMVMLGSNMKGLLGSKSC